jgi:tetratricopeptide (TPR) repeat protein
LNAGANSFDAARLFDEAVRLAGAGDYIAALNRLLQSQAQNPSRVESWHLLAQLQLQLGLQSEAIRAASIAVESAPAWADSRYILGRSLKAAGRVQEAIEQYQHAIRIDPTRPHYLTSLGVAYRQLGRLQEAVASYQAALALDPANREANNNLGNVLRELGQENEAARHDTGKSALTAELDDLVTEAASLHAKGEYKQALLRWTDVLRLAPDPDNLQALDGALKLATFAGDVERVARYAGRL